VPGVLYHQGVVFRIGLALQAGAKLRKGRWVMAYTYENFLDQAQKSGLYSQFSQSDLDTASKHPEFGMSILSLKKDYANATTDEQRLLANTAAEELRKSYGNYTGGGDGSKYYSAGKIPGQIDTTLDKMNSYGSFSYDQPAPTYNNQYAQYQQDLLDQIVNRPEFSWSKEQDPNWSAYKKQYLREGERATANALAQTSAASGGRPSSRAVTAATQAGDYYAGKLADTIPTLYQNAYQRYLDEYTMKRQDLGTVNAQEQIDYGKYMDQLGQWNTDRSFSYQKYLDDYIRLQSNLGALQGQDQVDYSRYMDEINRKDNQEALEYQRGQEEKTFYQKQLDAILSAGGAPSAELVGQSGYSNEYVKALQNYYQQQAAAAAATGSRGGSSSGRSYRSTGGNTTSGASQDYDQLFAAAKASGHPQSYISNNYKKFGFTNSGGLYNDYKTWLDGGNGTGGTSQSGSTATGTGLGTAGYTIVMGQVGLAAKSGDMSRAQKILDGAWPGMSAAEQEATLSWMEQNGMKY